MTHDGQARHLLGRLAMLLVVCAALLVLTFTMIRLVPGDPARRLAGQTATPEAIEAARVELGLTKPPLVQFEDYVTGVLRGDLGESFKTGEPVRDIIAERFPATMGLALVALALILVIGVPLGVVAGALTSGGAHRRFDAAFNAGTGFAGALPEYLAGTFLALVFAVWLRWLPVAGDTGAVSYVLPALAIAIQPSAYLARLVRVETLEVLASDFVRTARSKRLPTPRLFVHHVLPNVLTAALTMTGLLFASLIGGVILVENVFAFPGLGTVLVEAVTVGNYPVVQGIVLVIGAVVVLANALVDGLLVVIDPRRAQ